MTTKNEKPLEYYYKKQLVQAFSDRVLFQSKEPNVHIKLIRHLIKKVSGLESQVCNLESNLESVNKQLDVKNMAIQKLEAENRDLVNINTQWLTKYKELELKIWDLEADLENAEYRLSKNS